MSASSHAQLIGRVDDLQLGTLLYEGQHTLVYLARQISLDRTVVVKFLKNHVSTQSEWMKRFEREAKACARLKHPYIVDVYAVGRQGDFPYIVHEYVDGPSLKEVLAGSAPMPATAVLTIGSHLLQALQHAHQHGIIHRDVKPSNLLINRQGRAQLADFGLAQIGQEPSVTQQGSIVGTPAYMAPEQITGQRLSAQTDLFAAGAVFYEMLTGEQAFGGETYSTSIYKVLNEPAPDLGSRRPDLGREWIDFIERFLEKDPQRRWPGSQEALAALNELMPVEQPREEKSVFDQLLADFPRADDLPAESQKEDPAVEAGAVSPKPARAKLVAGLLASGLLLLLLLLFWQSDDAGPIKAGQLIATADTSRTETVDLPDSIPPAQETVDAPAALNRDSAGTETRAGSQADPEVKPAQSLPRSSDSLLTAQQPQAVEPELKTTSPEAMKASLKIAASPWAKLEINGQPVDSHLVAGEFDLEPGSYTLVFSHPSFATEIVPVALEAGQTKEIDWSFFSKAGYLWVEVRPWAEVYLNEKFRDTTPLDQPLLLSAGEYLLELRHPDFVTHRQYITISPGDTLRIQTTLTSR